jgi:hypothetical protein
MRMQKPIHTASHTKQDFTAMLPATRMLSSPLASWSAASWYAAASCFTAARCRCFPLLLLMLACFQCFDLLT